MTRIGTLAAALGATTLAALAVGACQSSSSGPAPAGVDAGRPAGDPAAIARGEYLVRAVAMCGECHTPRRPDGSLDPKLWLAGVPNRFDVEPVDDARGGISAPNLTPAALGAWTDDAIRRAMLDGVGENGPLVPVMPSYVFHNLKPADVDAIIAYLRQIPPIDAAVGGRQPLSVPPTAPAAPLADRAIPHTTLKPSDPSYARAERGRYLASVGLCVDCHSAWRPNASPPLALERLFAGGRAFSRAEWGVATERAPAVIYSYNLTPHASGLSGWTPAMVAATLKTNLDDHKLPLCRPMPGGPMGSYAALTDDDALDLGWYVTTLPPIDSGDIPQCPTPLPDADAGAGDAASDAPSDAASDAPGDAASDAPG